ncbi:hypothetical protein IT072_20665 (plasmid) [Leifsonia sp. ZF2019]|uniref:hypothetical protein n=1 Tax=Leifsonia sp. ZF2019 TaxID=2781978 RepID=UPI001CC1BE93|nr:hypothetical protein [Leifsonia sp. ZF2019]UAJ81750.1 hypothetical protein IT072_21100 [Leifsonia sp. ZF2019]UAJ81763.1 hypothetical protein IT072_20665 [Leifsonia sp. ZF2019]
MNDFGRRFQVAVLAYDENNQLIGSDTGYPPEALPGNYRAIYGPPAQLGGPTDQYIVQGEVGSEISPDLVWVDEVTTRYQWEHSTTGVSFAPITDVPGITGETTDTLTFGTAQTPIDRDLHEGWYQVRVTTGFGEIHAGPIHVTVSTYDLPDLLDQAPQPGDALVANLGTVGDASITGQSYPEPPKETRTPQTHPDPTGSGQGDTTGQKYLTPSTYRWLKMDPDTNFFTQIANPDTTLQTDDLEEGYHTLTFGYVDNNGKTHGVSFSDAGFYILEIVDTYGNTAYTDPVELIVQN